MEYILLFALGFVALMLSLSQHDKLTAKEQKSNNEPFYIMAGIVVYVLYITFS